jgi:hypothetical protein
MFEVDPFLAIQSCHSLHGGVSRPTKDGHSDRGGGTEFVFERSRT